MMLCFEKQDTELAMSAMIYHAIITGSASINSLVYTRVRRDVCRVIWDNMGSLTDQQVKEDSHALL